MKKETPSEALARIRAKKAAQMRRWRERKFGQKTGTSWFVYDLIDPRTGKTFYVGCTQNIEKRLFSHRRAGPRGAAFNRIREIEKSGKKCEIKAISEHSSRSDAFMAEAKRILEFSGLVNRLFSNPALVTFEPGLTVAERHRKRRRLYREAGLCPDCGGPRVVGKGK